jgi:hypothetical protein
MNTSTGDLPDELIIEMCNRMDYSTLYQYTQSAARNYELCNQILKDKLFILQENKRKLKIKNRILELIPKFNNKNLILDVSDFDYNTDKGYSFEEPSPSLTQRGYKYITGYNIVTKSGNEREILDILNTQPMQ